MWPFLGALGASLSTPAGAAAGITGAAQIGGSFLNKVSEHDIQQREQRANRYARKQARKQRKRDRNTYEFNKAESQENFLNTPSMIREAAEKGGFNPLTFMGASGGAGPAIGPLGNSPSVPNFTGRLGSPIGVDASALAGGIGNIADALTGVSAQKQKAFDVELELAENRLKQSNTGIAPQIGPQGAKGQGKEIPGTHFNAHGIRVNKHNQPVDENGLILPREEHIEIALLIPQLIGVGGNDGWVRYPNPDVFETGVSEIAGSSGLIAAAVAADYGPEGTAILNALSPGELKEISEDKEVSAVKHANPNITPETPYEPPESRRSHHPQPKIRKPNYPVPPPPPKKYNNPNTNFGRYSN